MTYPFATRNTAGMMSPRLAELAMSTMIWSGTSTGSGNAQVISPEFPGLLKGHPTYVFVAGYSNTGATTLSIDGGATNTSLRKADGTALIGGEIIAGAAYTAIYDGTYWRLLGGAGGASFLTGAATKTTTYTVALTDNKSMIEATGTWTLSLPSVATAGAGFTIVVSNTGTGTITFDPNGSELVNGGLTLGLPPQRWAILLCDGTGWRLMMAASAAAFSATTWNPSDKNASITLSNGNLTASTSSASAISVRSTTITGTGKYYWEVSIDAGVGDHEIGAGTTSATLSSFLGADANGWGYGLDGRKYNSNAGSSYGSSFTVGDIVGIALDTVNGKIWFSKNGVWQASGDPAAGTNPAFSSVSSAAIPMMSEGSGGTSHSATARFSQSSWAFAAPTGFSQIP
ncbi:MULTISPECIES: SPRY domain-containing protein [unclassified Azospirillum]|uniref:SPRY domain-containing protein n=1 Tax=unclassified Azospirillum TaxID=2630922 RepID=UPI000D64D2F0|nr:MULTISPECIES: SPRY domain-containing protein [unclassified Azospirillum]